MPTSYVSLQHDEANAAHVFRARLVPAVDAARDGRGAVVVQVIVQRAVAGAEALLVEEEGVVEECECVEDVEAGLFSLANTLKSMTRYAPSSTESAHPS